MKVIFANKHLVNKIVELAKFLISVSVFCFMLLKAPEQAATLVTYAGAFLLGSSKIKEKLGL